MLIDVIPSSKIDKKNSNLDSLSNVAPFRVVNIGNSTKIKLLDFIEAIEEVLGKKALEIICQCKKVMLLNLGRYL